MILGKATIEYRYKEGLPNYSNHEAVITMDFSVTDEDVEAGTAETDRRIDYAQAMAEKAVMRSIARARRDAHAAAVAAGPVNGHANGNGHAAQAPPPAAPSAPPPSNRMAAPPNAPVGRGNAGANQLGAPTNARTFGGWINSQPDDVRKAATRLMKSLGYGWMFKDLTDQQAVYVYDQLVAAPAANGRS